MVVADLHAHTTNSDGTVTLSGLIDAAREAGLAAVAVTDHDRLHPAVDEPISRRGDVTLVHGIELRVDAGEQRVDLLGYGVRETDALAEECASLQRDRTERARAIVECLEERLGVSVPIEPGPGVGRPHVARAVAEVTEYTVQDVFDEFIGDDGPCYVARDVPSFERGRELLMEACALAGLAHPLRYPDPEAALSLCDSLDAVERSYPYEGTVDPAPVDEAIEAYGLLPTGGSDAHGEELGLAGLDETEWERVRDRLPV
ncbi:PHP domain-containing protein [Halomicrobium urmianum]|uniref:PHP domain-containing protein n=1 Tax=Halomicrobium urmianum TaxID=1586233 RepID=UPI001CD9F947|nr:PHP domain-containing protein [Halomicrobium urmianum]